MKDELALDVNLYGTGLKGILCRRDKTHGDLKYTKTVFGISLTHLLLDRSAPCKE